MHVSGSTALVTGANRGIGKALVEALLARGAAKVYATARNIESIKELSGRDSRVVPLELDITNPEHIANAARHAADATLLVNNAGSLAFADLLGGDLGAIESDFRTNFLGTLTMSRTFAPVIEHNGGGALVNLLTLIAFAPVPAMGGYSASKAALHSATLALRAQLSNKGISVHGVFPGAVDTDMIRGFDIPKTSAADVAVAILDGVESDEENIFPDAMAQHGYKVWRDDPKALEQQMASMG